MKKISLILFSLSFSAVAFTQEKYDMNEYKKKFSEAEKFMAEENYKMALPLYTTLHLAKPDNANICYKAGQCFLRIPEERIHAIEFLEKAILNISPKAKENSVKEVAAPIYAYKVLADAYHLNGKYDLAIVTYDKFESFIADDDGATKKMIEREVAACKAANELTAMPVNIEIKNLGANINTQNPEYSAVISADEYNLIFTSRRKETTGGKMDPEDRKYFEDIYISTKTDSGWAVAKNIGAPINTVGHEATVSTSVDGATVFIYRGDGGDGNIYSTSLNGEEWSIPEKLSAYVNSSEWESHASMSADGNKLYFTSARKGGLGGKDIYMSIRLPNGQWGAAMSLGNTINTDFEEDAPFIHPDGKTLYFSSQGHKTMGGFDIFMSQYDAETNQWSEPRNIGYPVNTVDDDVFFVMSPDGKRAYYSSVKPEGFGDQDIYQITFPDKKQVALALVSGVVLDPYGKVPADVVITVTDNVTGDVVGTYLPNSKTGRYVFILPPGKNYNISYEAEGYLFHSENIDITDNQNYYEMEKAVELAELTVGSKVVLNNIFFDFDKATLRPESAVELDKIKKLLLKNPELVIEISGHTDYKGNDAYNMKLSQDRAQSVVSYLCNKGGIECARTNAKGYGETVPLAPNQNSDGSDNKPNMQLNRRVEMKILQNKK
ncbi:MAG TPA: OmpA family protein [Bacteroidia bacterium]|nr:OmpA family protein [Bacteroidia bacterium]